MRAKEGEDKTSRMDMGQKERAQGQRGSMRVPEGAEDQGSTPMGPQMPMNGSARLGEKEQDASDHSAGGRGISG